MTVLGNLQLNPNRFQTNTRDLRKVPTRQCQRLVSFSVSVRVMVTGNLL